MIPQNIPLNVEHLDLSNNIFNNISSKSFIKWTNLRELKINNCEIKSIDKNAFEGLIKLKNLYVTNNDIKSLDVNIFVNLNSLLHVYLSFNEFESIPPLKSFSITRLNLDGNHINNARIDESFKINTKLRTLVLTNNKIGSLNKSDFINLRNTGLQSLMLKMNNIDYIDQLTFEPVKDSLQTLELEGNKLLNSVQLELALRSFSGGSKLIFIDLRNTGLTNITRTFFQPLVTSHLHRIDIGDNPQLTIIDDDAFHELDKVQYLIADKCKISNSKIKFSSLNNLREMNLGHNILNNCPRHLPGSLMKIDLSHNEIRLIIKDDFKSLSSLTNLNLANNAIASIELESFVDLAQLKVLDLSYNRLTTIHQRTFVSLSSLSMLSLQQQSPCLKVIMVNSFILYNLLKLDLSRNCLDFSTLSLPIFNKCPQLSDIILTSNNIENLTDSFFDGCKNLSLLNLSHNRINGWSRNTFTSLTSTLVNVDLSFNDLTNLSMVSSENNFVPTYFDKLQNISLSNNHWNCSCTAVSWILSHKGFLHDRDRIICEHPNDKSGRKLFDVREMKDCRVKVIVPGVQHLSKASSGEVVSSILSVIFMIVIIIGIYCMRKRLKLECRRLFRWFSKDSYSRMRNESISESRLYGNPILEEDMLNMDQSSLVINEQRIYENPILDEDIPEMNQNSLVINDFSYTDSFEENGNDSWIIPISLEPYEVQEDIIFLSQKSDLFMRNISMKIINNFTSFNNKVTACHCSKLVVDFPPLDIDLLKVIIEERRKKHSENEERRKTYLFYSDNFNKAECAEYDHLFEAGNVKQYNLFKIEDQLIELF